VALYQPEIPPNTGNIIRLCANTGFVLHLIKPLGFKMDHKQLRRAGLDYHEFADVQVHESLDGLREVTAPQRWHMFTTRAQTAHTAATFTHGDTLIFGPETRGLPAEVIDQVPQQQRIRLPMLASSRSLNLSNAVAIAVFEAWRQLDFHGSTLATGSDISGNADT